MDPLVEGNHGKNSKRRVARILCLSSLAKFDYSLHFYFYESKTKAKLDQTQLLTIDRVRPWLI